MRKGTQLLLIFLAIVIGVVLGIGITLSHSQQLLYEKRSLRTSISSTPAPLVGVPIELQIPKIQVNAYVEEVGLDAQKRMDIPRKVIDVAWYKLGYKPGEKGSAVIDGHYDTVTGAGAVFYNLNKLTSGDHVVVVDQNKKKYTFRVTKKETYAYTKVPLQTIFASNDKSRLNLITCSGTWDKANKNYLSRTVVYAEMK